MKFKFPLLVLYFSFQNFVQGQTLNLRLITPLPNTIHESSGISTINPGYIWTHNDGGGNAELYKVDTSGKILRTVSLKNANNIDWEDLTRDYQNNFYIGDFGNNDNKRKNLKIYLFKDPDSMSIDVIPYETIQFSYPNQIDFPPSDSQKNFDTEAFFYFDASLYIFTKNRTVPFTGYTYMYKIPAKPGVHIATLLDSFKTGNGIKEMWWITAACLSPDKQKMALLSSDKMFLFEEFTGDNFLKGKSRQINFNSFSQKEAMVFLNNEEFYLTDEYTTILQNGGNLYHGNLKNLDPVSVDKEQKKNEPWVRFYQNTSTTGFIRLNKSKELIISLYDLNGKKINQYTFGQDTQSIQIFENSGIYLVRVTDGLDEQNFKIQVLN